MHRTRWQFGVVIGAALLLGGCAASESLRVSAADPVPTTSAPQTAPELAIPPIYVGPNGRTFGRMPNQCQDFEQCLAAAPDYIGVLGDHGAFVAGFAKKSDMYPTVNGKPNLLLTPGYAIYADDGETVVGHFHRDGRGFVPAE
jgi:hypothetical protein